MMGVPPRRPGEIALAEPSSAATASDAAASRTAARTPVLLLLLAFWPADTATAEPDVTAFDRVVWTELPSLPEPPGVAGAYVGVVEHALVVLGGANFPDGRPWQGAQKQWYAGGWALREPTGSWSAVEPLLPRPLGYGAAVSWRRQMVCAGGSDADGHHADAWLIRYDGQRLRRAPLPPLPQPRAMHAGALIGNLFFIVGGSASPGATAAERDLWSLDLAARATERRWIKRPPLPGEGRILPGVAVQDGRLHVFGGAALADDGAGGVRRRFLTDHDAFDPVANRWRRCADAPAPIVAPPTPAMTLGQTHFLTLAGDDGEFFLQQSELRDNHPGFPATLYAYAVVTDTWSTAGTFPNRPPASIDDPQSGSWPPVTTGAAMWRDRYVVATGEARPGVRTTRVWSAARNQARHRFGSANWTVLIAYLLGLIFIGWWFSRRNQSSDDFFLGGRRIPWWAAGLSLFGTTLSAITYLALPARSFGTDWSILIVNLGIVLIAVPVVLLYIPRFRVLQLSTAYQLLQQRFGLGMRRLGSGIFVAFQLGRMGIVLLLPALALSAATGLGVTTCIVVMGVLSTFYTVVGGFAAVVWTDVVQVVVLIAGAVGILLVAGNLEGGFALILEEAIAADKLQWFAQPSGWNGDTLPVLLLVGLFSSGLIPYTTDQAMVQRYLSTPTVAGARAAVWTNAAMTIPSTILFLSMGTALFVFYRQRPAELAALDASDQLVPWFIATQLPAGLAGLVIAGVFAATMSSLDSGMHSIATALTVDFIQPGHPGLSDRAVLRLARGLTLALGVLGTAVALLMAEWEIRYMFDFFLTMLGLLGGPLAGVFALAVLTRRVSGPAAWLGIVTGLVVALLWYATPPADPRLAGCASAIACFAAGLIASLAMPAASAAPGEQ